MSERTIPSINSLVKYDNPVLVTKHADKKGLGGKGAAIRSCSPPKGGAFEQKKETEEILNAILPPKEWEEEGNLWMQQVGARVSGQVHDGRILILGNFRFPPYRRRGWMSLTFKSNLT